MNQIDGELSTGTILKVSSGRCGVIFPPTAGVDEHNHQEHDQANGDNHHLHKVGHGDGPHTARHGIDEDNHGSADDADMNWHTGQGFKDVAERDQQCARPTDLRRNRGYRRNRRSNLPVSNFEKINDCQQAQSSKNTREEKADYEQTKRATKRIGN